jgi:hypothetical protein
MRQLRSILVSRGACAAALPPFFFTQDAGLMLSEWSVFIWSTVFIFNICINKAADTAEKERDTALKVAAVECKTAVKVARMERQAAQDAAVATLEAKLEAQAEEALRATRGLQEQVAMLRTRLDKAEAKVKVCLPACNNQGLGVLPSAQQSGSFWLQGTLPCGCSLSGGLLMSWVLHPHAASASLSGLTHHLLPAAILQ